MMNYVVAYKLFGVICFTMFLTNKTMFINLFELFLHYIQNVLNLSVFYTETTFKDLTVVINVLASASELYTWKADFSQ